MEALKETVAKTTEITRKGQKHWLFYFGIALLIISLTGISYFVLIAVIKKFPSDTLTSSMNWLFIGAHILLGAISLLFLSLRK